MASFPYCWLNIVNLHFNKHAYCYPNVFFGNLCFSLLAAKLACMETSNVLCVNRGIFLTCTLDFVVVGIENLAKSIIFSIVINMVDLRPLLSSSLIFQMICFTTACSDEYCALCPYDVCISCQEGYTMYHGKCVETPESCQVPFHIAPLENVMLTPISIY